MAEKKQPSSIAQAFGKIRGAFWGVGLVSGLVNLLMLTGPIFMLQVYDRVLASGSVPTLLVLLGLVVGLYALAGVFDFLRNRILSRAAQWLESYTSKDTFRTWIRTSSHTLGAGYKPLGDLAAVRGFMSSPTILAVFDLPWFPFYLAIVFVLHPYLGLLAILGAVVVTILAIVNEAITSKAAGLSSAADLQESRFADQAKGGSESLIAMGMVENSSNAWLERRNQALHLSQQAIENSQVFSATSKYSRMLLQSAVLAMGAYLAILQEISAGAIVAASIISGRALAPIDQVVSGWRNIKQSRLAYKRLSEYLADSAQEEDKDVALPAPKANLAVGGVTKLVPGGLTQPNVAPILANVNFELQAGDGLGVIGHSASGKSSLAKLLTGIWVSERGTIRLDGATYDQWDPNELGKHIGYIPQDTGLLSGTIAQNIARFDPEADDQEILEAAKRADVHSMILELPDGYSTSLDPMETPLTGGQRQRIALARAIYKTPFLVVLDEPNSNLDSQGDAALAAAIAHLREQGSIVIVMAHRPSAIAAVNKVLMLHKGRVQDFGDKTEVLQRVTKTTKG